MGKNNTGKTGEDLDILVPLGTIVCNAESGLKISELIEDDQRLLVAKGGKHGFGNLRFKSSTNRAPRKFTKGALGEELNLKLELRLLADAGFLGKPNVGKSSLMRAMTKAKPKVANYPFTTLNPSEAVVDIGYGDSYVIADIPGLIEGAAEGIGLGTQFLKHLSRTNILLHVLDIQNFSSEGKINDLTSINNELEKFDVKLANKRQYLIFNKVDLLDTRELEEKKKYILNYYDEKEVFFTSAVGNIGIEDLKKKIFYEITKNS